MTPIRLCLATLVLEITSTACTRAPAAPSIAVFDDRLALLAVELPHEASPGQSLEGLLRWEVRADCAGTEPQVLLHVDAPGGELRIAQADHAPGARASIKTSATEWHVGQVIEDVVRFTVPADIGVDTLDVYVGIYEGKQRWRASPNVAGDDRVKVATLHVQNAPPLWPEAHARAVAAGDIIVDGALDEAAWQSAQVLGPFIAYDGKSRIERTTTARIAYGPDASGAPMLYLAFTADDPDPFTPYTKRDDPLYDSEALEIFIDADGDKDVYVELQSAPNDLHFDAAFAGGRRKNMDKSWDAPFETKTVIDAATHTLTQEWRIPVASLKDVPAGEPRAGAVWRINLFRLERVRDPARAKVVRSEASAWCTPLSGDFHNLDRFCALHFD